jgi:hypothetical protein
MESLNDALIACITAAGGSKQVGPALWPEKAPESAQRMLLDCMNEDRPAKLSPEQVLLVLRLARAKGYHDGMNFIAADLGYGTPVPVEPRDEVADLMRAFNDSVAQQALLAARIEKAAGRLNMRAVA